MLQEYIQGNTPNPDVMCNSEIKFGAFYKYVQDFVATGHYARKLNFRDSNYKAKKEFLEIEDFDFIARSKDKKKDQSYFLWKLKKDQLAKILFPAGEFNSKMELREYAKTRDLITANKKDSQGLCFIGKTPLRNLLATKFGLQTGKILDLNTNLVIGEHPGAFLYTIGQREKLGLSGGPWFVAKIDIKENLVYVVHNDQKEKLNKNQLKINSINLQVPNSFLQLISEKENQKYFLKILSQARYHGEICEIKINLEDLLEANYDPKKSVLVEFLNFVKSPAVGQSLVFYFDEIMLGGGVISEN
jgi:tRNA-specific 2-thiouridylase